MSSVDVSHLWTSTLNNHLDDGVVVFKQYKFGRPLGRRIGRDNIINILQERIDVDRIWYRLVLFVIAFVSTLRRFPSAHHVYD